MAHLRSALGVLGVAIACRDVTPPVAPLMLPSFVSADLAGIDSMFFGSAAMYSFSGRAFRHDGPYHVLMPNGETVATPRVASGLFADSILGRAFAFDCVVSHYVPDDSLSGAAPDGIRIALYWEDDSHRPVCPLTPVGFLDARDVGSIGSPSLDIKVASISGDTTFLQESVTASVTGGEFRLATIGFLADGARRFDLSGTAMGNDSNVVDTIIMTRTTSGARVLARYQWIDLGTEFATSGDLQLAHGQDTVRITGTSTVAADHTFDLDVLVNGSQFGTISLHLGDTLVMRGPSGRDVTLAEREAMSWLLAMVFFVHSYLDTALRPLADLLQIRTYLH